MHNKPQSPLNRKNQHTNMGEMLANARIAPILRPILTIERLILVQNFAKVGRAPAYYSQMTTKQCARGPFGRPLTGQSLSAPHFSATIMPARCAREHFVAKKWRPDRSMTATRPFFLLSSAERGVYGGVSPPVGGSLGGASPPLSIAIQKSVSFSGWAGG